MLKKAEIFDDKNSGFIILRYQCGESECTPPLALNLRTFLTALSALSPDVFRAAKTTLKRDSEEIDTLTGLQPEKTVLLIEREKPEYISILSSYKNFVTIIMLQLDMDVIEVLMSNANGEAPITDFVELIHVALGNYDIERDSEK